MVLIALKIIVLFALEVKEYKMQMRISSRSLLIEQLCFVIIHDMDSENYKKILELSGIDEKQEAHIYGGED